MAEPTQKQIEAAAKMLCYLNGIPECSGSHPDCGPPCTPETCQHGMRDFAKEAEAVARAVVNADRPIGAELFRASLSTPKTRVG